MKEPKSGTEPEGTGSLTGLRLRKVPIGPDPDQFVVFAEDTESTTVVVPEPVGIGEIIDVVSHAMEVFGGDRTKALRWFRTPIPSLNDETPEEMLQREGGIEQVQEVLGRIEHGVW